MPVRFEPAETPAIPAEKIKDQIDKILRSEAFRGSEILRHLLEYLADCSLQGRTESVKVKEIARAVFGRSENFDSQGDSVVRVHTGRLRSKLAEYYVEAGAEDDLIIGIPKGSYGLSWHERHPPPNAIPHPAALPILSGEISPPVPITPTWKPDFPNKLIWSLMLIVLSSGLTWVALRWTASQAGPDGKAAQPALRSFWLPFLDKKNAPLIVFSNFQLVGSLDTSVRPYGGSPDGPPPDLIDTYTTVGEVMGVFDVTRTLAEFNQAVTAKHGQLLTWDDAKDRNLIFVGGPLADTPLRVMSATKDLQFRKGLPGLPRESAGIVNLHPREGEQKVYVGPDVRPYRFDYAIVALEPGFEQNSRTLILAGITEYGTQGAAEFVTRESHVTQLLSQLHVKTGASIPFFEALLRIKIQGGVPVKYELVFVHPVA